MTATSIADAQDANGDTAPGGPGRDRRAFLRWTLAAAVAILGHGVIAAVMLRAHPQAEAAMPRATVVIELTPIVTAPQELETETLPVPELAPSEIASRKVTESDSKEAPEVVEDKVEPERVTVKPSMEEPREQTAPVEPRVAMPESRVEPPRPSSQTVVVDMPEDTSEAELPPPPQPSASKDTDVQRSAPADDRVHERPNPEKPASHKPRQKQSPDRAVSKPQPAMARQDATPRAPAASTPSNSNALPNWKSQIVGILERNKRYPSAAEARHEHGVSDLAFSLNRQGRVTSVHIARSSGSSALDAETIALVHRVQPFPPPPPEVAGTQIRLIVPVSYD